MNCLKMLEDKMQKIENLQEQINNLHNKSYIIFLLGSDDFKISKAIRDYAKQNCDMHSTYTLAEQIASKFLEYDKIYYNNLSMYDSLENFLQEYEKQILDFIENGTDIIF